MTENNGHGYYPYQSWAGGAREDLEFLLDFGKEVEIDKFIFYLRADFPHDTYWKSLDIEFSDNIRIPAGFVETNRGQEIVLKQKKTTRTVKLTNFKQAAYPLSFAALSQIEVYGNYKKEDFSKMQIRNASNPKDVKHYTTQRLREEFHISNLFTKDNISLVYSHIDRIITGGLMPVFHTLKLEAGKELASDYFLQRREMGCINIGGKGIITIDGKEYEMQPRDGIYIGMGNKEITFKSENPEAPAKFYISSCPAHKEYPIVKIDISKAKKVPCGSEKDANKRVINQYIHPEVIKSCQLSMGLTQLEEGSVWNTMPTHTHDRRMEVYLYLDMDEDTVVFHMMGEPNETRHIVMHNEDAVISPSWSIHSGVGTKNYSFIWAMCGENQEFTDMDAVETSELL
jgi:4-deoxy-L-threo-5-hexosulose-uronate ketol-isomerase